MKYIQTRKMRIKFSDGKTREVPFVVAMRPKEHGDKPTPEEGYIAEEKKDGSLTLQYLQDGAVAYLNRRGANKTAIYPELSDKEPTQIETRGLTITHGETYALEGGTDSFEAFLRRDLLQDPEKAKERQRQYPLKYEAFDIIMKDGEWVADLPIEERKKILKETIPANLRDVKITKYSTSPARFMAAKKRDRTVEGVVLKKAGSPYRSGKRPEWRKVKFTKEADVVLTGYERGTGRRRDIGAVNAAVWDKKAGRLREVASVGTGFSDEELKDLKKRLDRGEKPIARVRYLKVGARGRLRSPSFRSLRTDITKKETHL